MVARNRHSPTFVLAFAVTAAGCHTAETGTSSAGKEGPGEAKRNDEPTNKPSGAGGDAAPTGGGKLDQDLLRDIEGIVANCEVNVERCMVNLCKNGEIEAFKERFSPDGDKNALDALDTWTATLTSDDGETQTVGACVMSRVMASFKHKRSELTVSPASARRIVGALPGLAANQTSGVIMPMTHFAALGGELDKLFDAAVAHERHEYLVPMVLAEAMSLGRLQAFPIVEAGGRSDAVAARAAALRAPRRMPRPTDAEKDAICPWAQAHLTEAEEKVFVEAAETMAWCGGAYLDAALDHGEARLAKHQFSREMSRVLKGICSTLPGSPAHTDAQCERSYAYLEKALKDKKLEGRLRDDALKAIWEQGRDEKALTVAKKYTADEDPTVQLTATTMVQRLRP